MQRIALVCLVMLLSACGTIQRYETAEQPIATPLTAGVGDVVLRVNRERDLTNIVGKADIWGRRTDEGFTEIRYLGLDPEGAAMFARQDITIRSNETTMTRMKAMPVPVSNATQATGRIGNYNYFGTSTSKGTAWVPTAGATTTSLPSGVIPIRLAPGTPWILAVGRHKIHVKDATSSSVIYSITQ